MKNISNKTAVEPPRVGENLKQERLRRHLSLGELAHLSGISKTMLSQIENGRVNPTLALMWRAAQTLGLELSALIDGAPAAPERFDRLTAAEQARIRSADGRTEFKLLTAPGMPDALEMYHVTLAPGAEHRSEAHAAGCMEYVMAIRGSVTLFCGTRETTLAEGDFIAYRGDLPHGLRNDSDQSAELHMTDLLRIP